MSGLKIKRKEAQLSQKQLGQEVGISQQSVNLYESGKHFPRKAVLDKLCKFFDCTIDDLL